ncbi:uncharacterized protein LOC118736382 [Rhagoletis pomonella]|uniref:uncharacterized protein LOC118736382 n=1 Tax=Rhagoletis pomonella TaxID=28610 RepID=UPI0017819804|nr:uncharacterized protein LOC118736382 [Rhagoletis pomonella]
MLMACHNANVPTHNRKVWTVVETKGLLKCYLARKEEFLHTRKKRNAYAHVLEDMVAQGFTDPSTTPVALEGKMRTLLSAFKCAKDAVRTGDTPCIASYMEEMEIFGNSALVANKHTYHLLRNQQQLNSYYPPTFQQHQYITHHSKGKEYPHRQQHHTVPLPQSRYPTT